MRFGVLIDEIRFGGVEKVAIEEVRTLTALGHDAVLVILRRTASKAFNVALSDVKKVYVSDLLPKPFRFSFKLPFFRFFSLFHLTYALLVQFVRVGTNFDVIISHGTFTCFSGTMLARKRAIPMIAFVWDPVLHILQNVYFQSAPSWKSLSRPIAVALGALLDRWICNQAYRVLTASRSHFDLLRRLAPYPSKVRLVFPGAAICGSISPHRKPYAILVTAWKEGKEPEYVLELARRVRSLQFVLAGAWLSESMRNAFWARTKELGLGNQVVIIGPVEEALLLRLYSEALVLLQLRADVGFGLPALEAAGQGCAFIIPEGQGACDMFTHGHDGFIVAEKDTDQIVEFLARLSGNPDEAIALGQNAWKTAHNFSWKNHAEHLHQAALEYYRLDTSLRRVNSSVK